MLPVEASIRSQVTAERLRLHHLCASGATLTALARAGAGAHATCGVSGWRTLSRDIEVAELSRGGLEKAAQQAGQASRGGHRRVHWQARIPRAIGSPRAPDIELSPNRKRSGCGWAAHRASSSSFRTSRRGCTGGPMVGYWSLPAGAVAGWGLHPLEKRRLVTAHVDSGRSVVPSVA
jgi:hypothetical protein